MRPFLEKVEPGKLPALDQDAERLEAAIQAVEEDLNVCFLGKAGVGKSTLINALIAQAERVLPAGGIGPMTARALHVRFAEEGNLEVEYFNKNTLVQVVNTLELNLNRQRAREASLASDHPDAPATAAAPLSSAAAESDAEILALAPDNATEEFRKVAALLVAGDQNSDRSLYYLLDRLREVLDLERRWDTTAEASDADRLKRVHEALDLAGRQKTYTRSEKGDRSAFLAAVNEHASGHLAPLIRELRLGWNHDALASGIALVDLPGIGIAGDLHALHTEQWIRERARGIVLVVSPRGVGEEEVRLLWSSGLLPRLLHAADDPAADPVTLLVAVVRADEPLTPEKIEAVGADVDGYFAEVCRASEEQVCRQLRMCLERLWSGDDGGSEERINVVERILDQLKVYSVSAKEYRLALVKHKTALLSHPDVSNISRMRDGLKVLATSWRSRRAGRLVAVQKEFCERVISLLRVVQEQWQQETRSAEELERLANELETFLGPRRDEFHARQGAYREFLRQGLPAAIDTLVGEARAAAARKIKANVAQMEKAHVGTLRAAVSRGGSFRGAWDIQLPHECGLIFEEAIAALWGKRILKTIRDRTAEFAGNCADLVREVVDWARQRELRGRFLLVDAQWQAIQSDGQKLRRVGGELVDDVRERVKNRLIGVIREAIVKRCEVFEQQGCNRGKGVKNRILDLFRSLAEEVTDAASGPATEILKVQAADVEKEIRIILDQHANPLDRVQKSIVPPVELIRQRGDEQGRKAI